MIKNMHKKSLTVLCLCFSLYPTIFSMKTMDDFKAALNKSDKNLNELIKLADELSKDKKNYHKIALLVHPDKAQLEEKELFEEICKAANNSNEQANKAISITKSATAEDIERVKFLDQADNIKNEIEQLNTFPRKTVLLINLASQIKQEISHSFIDQTVDASFGLILKKLAPGAINNIELQEILYDIKDRSSKMDDALTMHAEHRKDLQKTTAKNYTNAQKKLQSHLKKEKK